jgi:hypothetical protein
MRLLYLALLSAFLALPACSPPSLVAMSSAALGPGNVAIAVVPSVTSGVAPLDVTYHVDVVGNLSGNLDYFHLVCFDDEKHELTEIEAATRISSSHVRYTIKDRCQYETDQVATPLVFISYGGVGEVKTIEVQPGGAK